MSALRETLRSLFGIAKQQTLKASKIDYILDAVTEVTGVSKFDMLSNRRKKEYAYARHMAMYVARETTQYSLVQIGHMMNRDHTTVIYAADKLSKRGRGRTKLNRDLAAVMSIITA